MEYFRTVGNESCGCARCLRPANTLGCRLTLSTVSCIDTTVRGLPRNGTIARLFLTLHGGFVLQSCSNLRMFLILWLPNSVDPRDRLQHLLDACPAVRTFAAEESVAVPIIARRSHWCRRPVAVAAVAVGVPAASSSWRSARVGSLCSVFTVDVWVPCHSELCVIIHGGTVLFSFCRGARASFPDGKAAVAVCCPMIYALLQPLSVLLVLRLSRILPSPCGRSPASRVTAAMSHKVG